MTVRSHLTHRPTSYYYHYYYYYYYYYCYCYYYYCYYYYPKGQKSNMKKMLGVVRSRGQNYWNKNINSNDFVLCTHPVHLAH